MDEHLLYFVEINHFLHNAIPYCDVFQCAMEYSIYQRLLLLLLFFYRKFIRNTNFTSKLYISLFSSLSLSLFFPLPSSTFYEPLREYAISTLPYYITVYYCEL